MRYALVGEDRRLPEKGTTGKCPSCGGAVIPKCGDINSWHWAHKSADCDPWSEGETDWHIWWKEQFPVEWREVVVGNHRADIMRPDNKSVIEIQFSSISPCEIQEREEYYGDMTWIFNAEEAYSNGRLSLRRTPSKGVFTFRWKQARRSIEWCDKHVVLDLGMCLYHIKKIYSDGVFSGWGRVLEYHDFINLFSEYGK